MGYHRSAKKQQVDGAWALGPYYDDVQKAINSNNDDPSGLTFNPDGTKMYIVDGGGGGTDEINEYALSTAWDITSATYTDNFDYSAQGTQMRSMTFGDNGSKMYTCRSQYVHEWDLSTAYDVSTATHVQSERLDDGGSSIPATEEIDPEDVVFNPSGTKMYAFGQHDSSSFRIVEYDLSTAWDISTASYNDKFDSAVGNISGGGGWTFLGGHFNPDGTAFMFPIYASSAYLIKFSLSTAWDISTMSQVGSDGDKMAVIGSPVVTTPNGCEFKADGTAYFNVGHAGGAIERVEEIHLV